MQAKRDYIYVPLAKYGGFVACLLLLILVGFWAAGFERGGLLIMAVASVGVLFWTFTSRPSRDSGRCSESRVSQRSPDYMRENDQGYVHEIVQGIDVITLCDDPDMYATPYWTSIKDGLFDLADGGVERFVLDCRNVEHLTEDFIGMLSMLRERLLARKRSHEVRPRVVFKICDDRESALDVISSSESYPLVLCSLSPEVREALSHFNER